MPNTVPRPTKTVQRILSGGLGVINLGEISAGRKENSASY